MTLVKNFSKENILNFFIYLLPMSFIAGNSIINFNLTLISLLRFYVTYKIFKLLKSKKKLAALFFFNINYFYVT